MFIHDYSGNVVQMPEQLFLLRYHGVFLTHLIHTPPEVRIPASLPLSEACLFFDAPSAAACGVILPPSAVYWICQDPWDFFPVPEISVCCRLIFRRENSRFQRDVLQHDDRQEAVKGVKMGRKLVAYFSAGGVTAKAAEELAGVTGADLYEIRPKTPYTKEDLDWRNKQSRSTVEMQDPSSRPELFEEPGDLSGYDTVYIGFPIWWGVAPHVVNTFIEHADLAGKTIGIFATSGGSGIDYALSHLKEAYPNLAIQGGKLLRGKVTEDIL